MRRKLRQQCSICVDQRWWPAVMEWALIYDVGQPILEKVACLLANQAGAQIAQLCPRVLQVCV
jgi:hypothetical protein